MSDNTENFNSFIESSVELIKKYPDFFIQKDNEGILDLYGHANKIILY